jgi:hypothetical protein
MSDLYARSASHTTSDRYMLKSKIQSSLASEYERFGGLGVLSIGLPEILIAYYRAMTSSIMIMSYRSHKDRCDRVLRLDTKKFQFRTITLVRLHNLLGHNYLTRVIEALDTPVIVLFRVNMTKRIPCQYIGPGEHFSPAQQRLSRDRALPARRRQFPERTLGRAFLDSTCRRKPCSRDGARPWSY